MIELLAPGNEQHSAKKSFNTKRNYLIGVENFFPSLQPYKFSNVTHDNDALRISLIDGILTGIDTITLNKVNVEWKHRKYNVYGIIRKMKIETLHDVEGKIFNREIHHTGQVL